MTDSKKLTAAKREELAVVLRQLPHAVAYIEADDIDRQGMSSALRTGFRRAVQTLLDLGLPITGIRIDGNPLPLMFGGIPTEFIVKGDALDWRIGAASILAKVARDEKMVLASKTFPAYGWEKNKGYGSPEHQEAIRKHGLTPLHRATFCRRFVGQEDNVLDLFS